MTVEEQGETPDQQPQGETPAAATPAAADDLTGLKALVEKLRQFERDAKPQLKELARLRAEDEERRRATMTDMERLTAERDEAAREREALRAENRRYKLLAAAAAEADRAGLPFHPGALEDALRLGDLDVEEVDGKFKGLAPALKDLAQRKPWLVRQPAAPETDATAKGRGGTGFDGAAYLKRLGVG